MTLTHTGSNTTGTVVGFSQGDRVVLTDRYGTKQIFKALDGAFKHEGIRVGLTAPPPGQRRLRGFTPSGSVSLGDTRARVARAGRIWVEGIHDAELIEKVWGDDLRVAGVVVEPLHGIDGLVGAVAVFRPARQRRLGVLLDHLVDGSKEARLAASVNNQDVLICGHPYVDIWAAITPITIGIDAWPDVPVGRPWKAGVLEALGIGDDPGAFWSEVLGQVQTYRDIEAPLVNAVEQLIDFVTTEAE